MNLITIKTFDNSLEAHLLKAKLESEGIVSYLFDENMITMNLFYNITLGGIKLKINALDVEKANQIIHEIEKKQFISDDNRVISCPNCHSNDLYADFKSLKSFKGFLSFFFAFMLFTYPIYFQRVFKCKNCDFEFKK